jgi:hypothetical protein
MRRAPQSGFSMLIRRISARSSVSICGRPPRRRDFQRKSQRKPALCQRKSVSGRTIVSTFRIDGNQRYSRRKKPSIMVRQPDATVHPTPQDNQLMSKHRVLGFKPQLRLEWRGQDGQDETEQPDHSASLGDSVASSTRIGFLERTGTGPSDTCLWSLEPPNARALAVCRARLTPSLCVYNQLLQTTG